MEESKLVALSVMGIVALLAVVGLVLLFAQASTAGQVARKGYEGDWGRYGTGEVARSLEWQQGYDPASSLAQREAFATSAGQDSLRERLRRGDPRAEAVLPDLPSAREQWGAYPVQGRYLYGGSPREWNQEGGWGSEPTYVNR